MPNPPPCFVDRLLSWLIAPHLREEVLGDLHERYSLRVERLGASKARWRYWFDMLAYMRPSMIKRKPSDYPQPTNTAMLRNYLLIAFRNLLRNKLSSFTNMSGLAVGMAVALLIGLWIYDEFSFNTYHEKYDRIAQVRTFEFGEEGVGVNSSLPYPLGTTLKQNYRSHFKHLVMASWDVDNVLSAGDKNLSGKGLFIEPDAPEMLTLKMRYGSRAGLTDPHSIMLSASMANALFGDGDPTNQVMKISNKLAVKVTGVYDDLPQNTQFHELSFLAPFALWVSDNPWIQERAMTDWGNHFLKIYAEIKPDTDFEKVAAAIKNAELTNLANFKEEAKRKPQVFLLPMRDWHLRNYKRGVIDQGPIRMIYLIGTIGAFVLLLACINFMNLSTARSEKRAKEVGIRKATGSVRSQLINQFLSESFLVVLLAFLLAIALTTISLPWFNDVAARQITIPWSNLYFWLACLGFIGITGLLAGSYPAFYLSSFQPVKALTGTFRVGRLASAPRKVLVVLQFTVSVALIIGTIIVYRQIQVAKNRPVGYTRDGLLLVAMKSGDFYGKHDVLRNELLQTGAVSEMAESMGKVTEVSSGNGGFTWKGKNPSLNDSFGTLVVSPEYGKTVGWQFVKGRDFSRAFTSDSSGLVINEAAAKYMVLKNPVNEAVSWKFQNRPLMQYKILGVIKDMVMESPYEPTLPTIFMIRGHGDPNWINIKINPAVSTRDALPTIEAVFKKLIPTAPFEYKFVDQEYALKFAAEERIGKLAGFFASLAIFISCLGLFGLASYIAEQRTKEIGVRKVLGASVLNLWGLLSKDFVILVVIAFGIATPVAYYFLNKWLQQYTYRTELSWWIFAVSGMGALAITLLTISFQSIKAALVNPVTSLRSE
jgi:ABC-type antimicrobial peptide transport system permease subunit